MNIDYKFGSKIHTFEQVSKYELLKLSFLLTNKKGDFLNLGVKSNSCKYQGFNVCKTSTVEFFKFIEEILPVGVDVEKVEYSGNKVVRFFKSAFVDELNLNYLDDSDEIDEFMRNGHNSVVTKDSFFVGPTGGLIYEINNFEGDLLIDLDMKKKNDFTKNDRDYNIFSKNGVVYVEFSKKNDRGGYKLFMGIKAQNFAYDKVCEFVEKEYHYSRLQKSDWKWDVFRALKVKVLNNKKICFGCGFSLEEVDSQLEVLDNYNDFKIEISKSFDDKLFSEIGEFSRPMTERTLVAYELAKLANFKFLKTDLESSKVGVGCFAGFPYFTNVWARDDIFALKSLINLGEVELVKKRIDFYLDNLDSNFGGLRNLLSRDSSSNCDIVFMLCKRIEDFLFDLIERDELFNIYSLKELEFIFTKLSFAFNRIVKHNWHFDMELIKIKNISGFRDHFTSKFPLSVQILFLSFSSFMAFLAKISGAGDLEAEKYLDFEELLKLKVRDSYFKRGNLYDDLVSNKVTFSVFSSYYFYPNLFSKEEWENIFDKSLMVLKTGWSGISSLSSEHKEFISEHSGENRSSRTRGDSFFYMNNLAAICLNDLNELKYRSVISKILSVSVNDILVCGTIGFSSELSSSLEKRSEGNLAQLVSTSSFIELVDKLFDKK